jgi:hypothetical protein
MLYILVSLISTIHVIEFFELSNDRWLAITLAIAFEIGASASLASIIVLDKMNKWIVWSLFFILTAMQAMGNTYYAFSNLHDYQGWIDLFGLNEEEPIYQKRILSIVSGAILPLVALGFIKALVDYIRPNQNSDTSEPTQSPDKTPTTLEPTQNLDKTPTTLESTQSLDETVANLNVSELEPVDLNTSESVDKEVDAEHNLIVEPFLHGTKKNLVDIDSFLAALKIINSERSEVKETQIEEAKEQQLITDISEDSVKVESNEMPIEKYSINYSEEDEKKK